MENRVKKILSRLIVIFVAIAIIGYALWRTKDLIEGPQIKISSPINGATLESALVTLEGKAEHVAAIELNGRQIFVDQDGNFKEAVLLSYGYNILSLKASDRFGRTILRSLELIYK